MPTVTVTKRISADPQAIWSLLADFGNVKWIPVAGDVRVEGDGPGMRRYIGATGDSPVVERLVSIDHDARSLTYSIDENNPLPVSDYVSTVVVSGDTEATVSWTVNYEPTGPDEAARQDIDMIYGVMAGWLGEAATQ